MQAHNKKIKTQSYILGDKVWLNSKHLKTKRNYKLKAKFLGFFRVLYLVDKQTYKFKLLIKKFTISFIYWKNIVRKRQVNTGNNKEYEFDDIWNNAIKLGIKQLLGLYYLILWKYYYKEENMCEPISAIQYFWRLIIAYYKKNSKKLVITSFFVDIALQIARSAVSLRLSGKSNTIFLIKQLIANFWILL